MTDEDIEMKDETNRPIAINPKIENSKLPFVEKYRPFSLEQIISQDDIKKNFKKIFR